MSFQPRYVESNRQSRHGEPERASNTREKANRPRRINSRASDNLDADRLLSDVQSSGYMENTNDINDSDMFYRSRPDYHSSIDKLPNLRDRSSDIINSRNTASNAADRYSIFSGSDFVAQTPYSSNQLAHPLSTAISPSQDESPHGYYDPIGLSDEARTVYSPSYQGVYSPSSSALGFPNSVGTSFSPNEPENAITSKERFTDPSSTSKKRLKPPYDVVEQGNSEYSPPDPFLNTHSEGLPTVISQDGSQKYQPARFGEATSDKSTNLAAQSQTQQSGMGKKTNNSGLSESTTRQPLDKRKPPPPIPKKPKAQKDDRESTTVDQRRLSDDQRTGHPSGQHYSPTDMREKESYSSISISGDKSRKITDLMPTGETTMPSPQSTRNNDLLRTNKNRDSNLTRSSVSNPAGVSETLNQGPPKESRTKEIYADKLQPPKVKLTGGQINSNTEGVIRPFDPSGAALPIVKNDNDIALRDTDPQEQIEPASSSSLDENSKGTSSRHISDSYSTSTISGTSRNVRYPRAGSTRLQPTESSTISNSGREETANLRKAGELLKKKVDMFQEKVWSLEQSIVRDPSDPEGQLHVASAKHNIKNTSRSQPLPELLSDIAVAIEEENLVMAQLQTHIDNQNASQNTTLDTLRADIVVLKSERLIHKKRIYKLEKELKASKEAFAAQSRELEKAQNHEDDFNADFRTLQTEHHQSTKKRAVLEDEIEDYNKQYNALRLEGEQKELHWKRVLYDKDQEHDKNLNDLQNENQKQVETLQAENTKYLSQIRDLQLEVGNKNARLENKIREQDGQLQDLRIEQDRKESEWKAMVELKDKEYADRLEDLKSQKQDSQTSEEEHASSSSQQVRKTESSESEDTTLQQQLKKQNAEHSDKVSGLEDQITDLSRKLQSEKDLVFAKEKELSETSSQNQSRIQTLTTELAGFKQEAHNWEEKYTSKDQELKICQENVNQRAVEIDRLKAELQSRQLDLESLSILGAAPATARTVGQRYNNILSDELETAGSDSEEEDEAESEEEIVITTRTIKRQSRTRSGIDEVSDMLSKTAEYVDAATMTYLEALSNEEKSEETKTTHTDHAEELNSQIVKLQQVNDEKERVILNLQNQFKRLEEDKSSIEEASLKLTTEMQKLQGVDVKNKEIVKGLEDQIETFKQDVAMRETSSQELREKIRELKDINAKNERSLQQKQVIMNRLEETRKYQLSETARKDKERMSLEEMAQIASSEMEALEKQKRTLEEQVEDLLKNSTNDADLQVHLQKEIKNLQSEIQREVEQKKDLKKHIEEVLQSPTNDFVDLKTQLRNRFEDLQSKLYSHEERRATLERQLEDSQFKLQGHEERRATLEKQLEDSQSTLQDHEERRAALEKQVEDSLRTTALDRNMKAELEKQIELLNLDLQKQEKQSASYENDIKKLRSQIKSGSKVFEDSESRARAVSLQADLLTSQKAELEDRLRKTEANLKSEKDLKNGAEEKIKSLNRELERLKTQDTENEARKKRFDEELERLRTQEAENETRKKQFDEELQEKHHEIKSISEQRERLKVSLAAAEKSAGDRHEMLRLQNDLENKCANLRAELRSEHAARQELEKQHQKLSADLNDLNMQRKYQALSTEDIQKELQKQSQLSTSLTKKIEVLEEEKADMIRRFEGKIILLESQAKEMQKSLETSAGHLRQANSQIHFSQNEIRKGKEEIDKIKGDCDVLQEKIRRKESEIQNLQQREIPRNNDDAMKSLQDQLTAKSAEIEELLEKVYRQEEKVQKAQEAVFEKPEKTSHEFLDDGEVEEKLEYNIFGSLADWAKLYALRQPITSLDMDSIAHDFETIANPKESARIFEKYPRLVVQSLLAQFVVQSVLQQPFSLLSESQNGGQSVSELLQNLYETFVEVNRTEGHNWRFQTFQLLSQIQKRSTGLQSHYSADRLTALQLQRCEALADDFINGPIKRFLSPCNNTQERHEKLVNAIDGAAKITLKLWAQRAYLSVRGLKDHQEPFSWNSPHLKSHMVNRLSQNPKSRDGDPIAMFMQPEIVAYGNEEGEDYDKEKIWSRAVILLKLKA